MLSMIYYVCIHNGKVWHLADVSLMDLERCLGGLVGHVRTASMSRPPSIGVKDVLADTSTLARDVVLSGRYKFSMFPLHNCQLTQLIQLDLPPPWSSLFRISPCTLLGSYPNHIPCSDSICLHHCSFLRLHLPSSSCLLCFILWAFWFHCRGATCAWRVIYGHCCCLKSILFGESSR
jgi:hypothetical protein